MRRAAFIGALLTALSAAPALAAPIDTMVVGRGATSFAPRTLTVGAARVSASGHRCRVAADTALAVLAAARRAGGPAFSVSQEGGCQGLYVFKIGGNRASGPNGWVYKVGHAAPSTGAGEPTPSIRAGAQVTWLWCRMRASSCQRTLAISAGRVAKAGRAQRVVVRGYDDRGRGRPVAGALVRLGPASGRTGPGGSVVLPAPRAKGHYRITAARSGMVPAFPVGVDVR